jgi:hypothetical protein
MFSVIASLIEYISTTVKSFLTNTLTFLKKLKAKFLSFLSFLEPHVTACFDNFVSCILYIVQTLIVFIYDVIILYFLLLPSMIAMWAVVIIVQNPIIILAVTAYYDVLICVHIYEHTIGYLMQAANELAADNVGQFHLREAGELSANELAANELAADNVGQFHLREAGELSANELSANELSANELSANELSANELAANELAANELAANELAANELAANELAAKELAAKSSNSSSIF